jgi:hypothetical protein
MRASTKDRSVERRKKSKFRGSMRSWDSTDSSEFVVPAFMSVVMREAADPLDAAQTLACRDRGITEIDLLVQHCLHGPISAQKLMSPIDGLPHLQAHAESLVGQIEIFRSNLARTTWDDAADLISTDLPSAIEWVRYRLSDRWGTIAYRHMLSLVSYPQFVSATSKPVCDANIGDLYTPLIAVAGGAAYLLCVARSGRAPSYLFRKSAIAKLFAQA